MILYHFSFNFTCTLTYQELRKPIQLRLQTRRQDAFFYKSANIFSRYSMRKCFPKTAFKMTAPTFKLFTNKNKLQVHYCTIVLRQLHFFSISKTSWCGLPWWRSHQLSCNFSTRQHCVDSLSVAHFGLLWFDILTAAAGVLAWQGV